MPKPNPLSRRAFLALGALALFGLANVPHGRKPPAANPFSVTLPPFMLGKISDNDIAYLNETIPALYQQYADSLFPHLHALPAVIVVNTLTETLIQHGAAVIGADLLTDEALTLTQVQYLLTTTRFGSVATPHRGSDPTRFGKVIYLKQHPITGYRTPPHLLLEELLHAQQDITIMNHIIQQHRLPPQDCLHAHLKGISELGAHYITDELVGEPDYLFLMDDGTLCETAAYAVELLAGRLTVEPAAMVNALLHDVGTYAQLDGIAQVNYDRHIWEMVTTWRHARDENGDVIGIAPAYINYESPSLSSSSSD